MSLEKSNDVQSIERLISRVEKPGRYIGGEWNQVQKNIDQVEVSMVLAFPDVYEVGMSYLGFQILYELINSHAGFLAERCFTPWVDMEALLKENNLPLFSLENKKPVAQFDVIGITLQHEMSYTNVLNLIALSRCPVEREDRQDHDPIIIGGGPCAVNPEPVEKAFDLFVLGDGEAVIIEMLTFLKNNQSLSRQEKIEGLAQLDGVYAPAHYHPVYNNEGVLTAIDADRDYPKRIKRRVDQTIALPKKPLVPFLAPIHDRVTTQLFRGCTRGCRFCQAGMINRPIREQAPEVVIEQIKTALESTGYEEASLTSLSSGDYSQIMPLVKQLMAYCLDRDVALSFPSLRLDSFRNELAESVKKVRKTGLTFAPEAGSERLRQVINKGLDEAAFTESLAKVFHEGWDLIKLYFMIGLPTETDEDIEAIIDMVAGILRAGKQAKQNRKQKRAPRVNLGVNLFIPKPHTPFQWVGQLDRQHAKKRLEMMALGLPKAASFGLGKRTEEELNRSYLEAVLARGDRRLWPVIKEAWQQGATFDSWGDLFKFDIWMAAFEKHGVNPDDYACRDRSLDEVLPWDHLNFGISKKFLKDEYEKAKNAQLTPDCCRENQCRQCGAANPAECPQPLAPALPEKELPALRQRPETFSAKIRLCYEKKDGIRFVGHLDMVNAWRRAAKRAGLPVYYSQGFHPQPNISFGPPLPLGYVGLNEWMDIGLEHEVIPEDIVVSLNEALPNGLRVKAVYPVELKAPSLNKIINAGIYNIRMTGHDNRLKQAVKERIDYFWANDDIPVTQWSKKGTVTVNCRTGVHQLEMVDDKEHVQIKLLHESGRPRTAKLPSIIEYLIHDLAAIDDIVVERVGNGYLENNQLIIPVTSGS